MKKKWMAAAVILAAMVLCVLGFRFLLPGEEGNEDVKQVTITVINDIEGTELFSDTVETQAQTLGELLDETKELKAVMEQSTYGRLLVSLLDLNQGEMTTGPWWLFESDNNESCKASGFCPAVDQTVIADQDRFVFRYTDSY